MRGLENQHRHAQAPSANQDDRQNNSNLTSLTVRQAADGRQLSVDRRLYLGTHTSATQQKLLPGKSCGLHVECSSLTCLETGTSIDRGHGLSNTGHHHCLH